MADMQIQQLTPFIKESKVVEGGTVHVFNAQLKQALDDGWLQFGQPFAIGNCYAVNVVKLDGRISTMLTKVIDFGLAQLTEAGI